MYIFTKKFILDLYIINNIYFSFVTATQKAKQPRHLVRVVLKRKGVWIVIAHILLCFQFSDVICIIKKTKAVITFFAKPVKIL